MRLDREDVGQIENYFAKDFAGWLKQGIIDWEKDDRNVNAFSPLQYIIGHGGRDSDYISDLSNVYKVLPESAQKNFRNGIVIVLQLLSPTNRRLLRPLLHLSGIINNTAILPIINSWVNHDSLLHIHIQNSDTKKLIIADVDERKEFFALTLDIVAGMAPANGVAHTIRKLIGVKHLFLDGYAPLVFIALCRAEPENFLEHLKLLRDSFTKMHHKIGEDNAFITAIRFVRYVPAEVIQQNLCEMGDADKWLVKALFVGNKAPLKIVVK